MEPQLRHGGLSCNLYVDDLCTQLNIYKILEEASDRNCPIYGSESRVQNMSLLLHVTSSVMFSSSRIKVQTVFITTPLCHNPVYIIINNEN